jgi:hypothetical protein
MNKMKENIGEEIGRENLLMEVTEERKFHAYKFTGTDENINALRLLMQQMNKKFTIFRAYEFDCFCMSIKDIGGAMTYKDLDIGDWIIFKNEEGKEVISVTTDKLFSNYYEAVEGTCDEVKSTSTIKKEKRNAEVKAMELEVQSILSSAMGTTLKEVYDEVDLLHKKHLKSIRYTGTPENIKEIEDLVSSWDFEYISRRSFEFDYPSYTICRPARENIGYSDVSIFDYIEINDYVFEAYDSTNKVIKIN